MCGIRHSGKGHRQKQACFMKIELQFGSDSVGQNTENATKSWHMSWWTNAQRGECCSSVLWLQEG